VEEGADVDAVGRWLGERADVTLPLIIELIAGGRSNLTYRVTDAAGRRWVLRRPPLHSVLTSAHDVGREYRIMAALQDTAVPVPPLVGNEPDAGVIGAPFYVMEFVDGLVPRDAASVQATLDPSARRAVAFNLADTLADLHAVEADAVGLGDLSRPADYIARQLHRWSKQHAAGSTRTLPLVGELHQWLKANIPAQATSAIVHGDYRLDNLIIGTNGEIRAVVDWELCTLGDPLADLGLLQVYWSPPNGREMPMIPAAGKIPGVPAIQQVLDRYAARSGKNLDQIDYYVVFGHWKLAMVLEGVYTRFASGAYGQVDGSHEAFGQIVIDLLKEADVVRQTAGG
jgi:aminoglycoside phosphotransferase (APT) family kinase protein